MSKRDIERSELDKNKEHAIEDELAKDVELVEKLVDSRGHGVYKAKDSYWGMIANK